MHVITGNDNGGGGKYLLDLCNNKIDDFENIVGFLGDGYLYEKAKKLNISSFVFNGGSKLEFFSNICDYVERNSIDIVNFHGPKANFIHFFLKGRMHAKSVTTVHSNYKLDFINNNFKKIFYTPLSMIGLRSFSYYICVSDFIKNQLESEHFKGYKTVINSAIDFSSYNILRNREQIRRNYNINNDDFVFVCIARLHTIKNHVSLIRAFAKLKREKQMIKLLLVGDGDEYENLRILVNNLSLDKDVIFAGFQDNPIDFINAADINTLVSFDEGGDPPIVILESAQVKKSIICSNIGNIKNKINGMNGFLVNPLSVEDIYKKMKLAYEEREILPSMGENLYFSLKENHSIEKLHYNHYKFYKYVINDTFQ